MNKFRSIALCSALGLTTFLTLNSSAAIVVDGTRDAEYGAPLYVQSLTSSWGAGNVLASLSAKQEAGSLKVFLAGRPDGNIFILFIDSKSGGANVLVNNLISGGGEEYAINNFGTSASAGMTFETGFSPDYAIRIHNGGWTALYPLAPGSSRTYLGQSTVATVSGGPVTAIKTVWSNVTTAYGDHAEGVEMDLNLAGLGVPTLPGQAIKFMAILINEGSGYASNQTLGSMPVGTGDIGGNFKTLNFNDVVGAQTISMTVDNNDTDGDGIPDSTDTDDDNDGLADTVETNTGTFVDATNTGTNPLIADTDGDGASDGAEVTASTNPNKKNYNTMLVAGDFLTPTWSDTATSENTMSKVGEFGWTLIFNFRTPGSKNFKFLAGSWSLNWGAANPATPGFTANSGGENLILNLTETGFQTLTFNNDTRAYSVARTVFPDYASYAAAYALVGAQSDDDDSDSLSNGAEFTANTDPTRFNDALAPVITLSGNPLVGVALNSTYSDAGATATDNIDATVTVTVSGAVDTAVAGIYVINFDAADAVGNPAIQVKRTVVVYDPASGFASRFSSVTAPGDYTSPGTWDVSGGNGNSLTPIGNFKWRLLYQFDTSKSITYKIVGDGASSGWGSAYAWGAGGVFGAGNASATVNSGWYAFELDELANTASFTPVATPAITSASTSDGKVGDAFSYQIMASDSPSSYNATPLPDGLSVNTATGLISGNPTGAGTTVVTISATRYGVVTGTSTLTITIQDADGFASWSGGATLNSGNLLKYAVGGASSLTAGDGVKPVTTLDADSLSITAIIRTDATVTVVGLAVSNLADYSGGTIETVTGSEVGVDQTGVPAGCLKKKFSVSRAGSAKKFLKLQVTK